MRGCIACKGKEQCKGQQAGLSLTDLHGKSKQQEVKEGEMVCCLQALPQGRLIANGDDVIFG